MTYVKRTALGLLVAAGVGFAALAGISTARQVPAPTASPTAAVSPSAPATCHARGALPDTSCTPGVTNPAVTQATINQTICVSGWTATVRPPVSYTDALKLKQMTAYALPGLSGAYELDHLIPLELGGHPSDPRNLWPQVLGVLGDGLGAHSKDEVENYLKREVCAGRVSLATAQYSIATDWTAVWKGLHR